VSGGALPEGQRGTHNDGYIHVCDWFATFAHLAGVDPEDPNTVGHRYDGTPFALPGRDSMRATRSS
jgi:arylsulfatase A-like enzyme